jgi:hypothetical protein
MKAAFIGTGGMQASDRSPDCAITSRRCVIPGKAPSVRCSRNLDSVLARTMGCGPCWHVPVNR